MKISDPPESDERTPIAAGRFASDDAGSRAPMGTERGYRWVAALSPAAGTGTGPARLARWKLGAAAGACAVIFGGASTLALRPHAATRPAAPPPGFAVPYTPQAAAPPHTTYAVRVGPYHVPAAVLAAHQRLRGLGFEPIVMYGKYGIYLRALTTPEEPKATRIARGLQEEHLSAIVTETGPNSGLLKAVDAGELPYHTHGVLFNFEGGQSKGWEVGGSATALRNSSLFAFRGEHSLEVALQQTTSDSPGVLRLKVENVVLPQDRFLAHVLQPTSASGRLGAHFYLIDAQGTKFQSQLMKLDPTKWSELQLVVSQHVMLPIQEIGIEFGTPLAPWTGAAYVDCVEQQRPL